MMHDMLQQAANNAMALGPTVLVQGMNLRRPTDVVRAPALSVDDKRAMLAAWASDFTPSIQNRHSVNCREQSPFQSMKCSLPSKNSIGAMVSDRLRVQAACFIDLASRLIACSSERCPSQ
jgi:hypothetical protein